MKVVNSYIFRAVCALLVGILLVSNPERMTGLLVQVIGGLFLLSGLVSLVSYAMICLSDKSGMRPAFPLIFLIFFPALFVTYLMYVFGFLMVVGGVNQIWNLFRLRRLIPFRWYVLLAALVITGMGVFVLFKPMESAALPFILLGVNFILFGIAELVNGVRWRKYTNLNRKKETESSVVEMIEK